MSIHISEKKTTGVNSRPENSSKSSRKKSGDKEIEQQSFLQGAMILTVSIVIVKIMLPYNIDLTGKTVFLTGVAGFIGSNLAKQLLKTVSNIHIVGIDSMNDYYDVRLKEARLKEIEETLQAPHVQSAVASPPLKGEPTVAG